MSVRSAWEHGLLLVTSGMWQPDSITDCIAGGVVLHLQSILPCLPHAGWQSQHDSRHPSSSCLVRHGLSLSVSNIWDSLYQPATLAHWHRFTGIIFLHYRAVRARQLISTVITNYHRLTSKCWADINRVHFSFVTFFCLVFIWTAASWYPKQAGTLLSHPHARYRLPLL